VAVESSSIDLELSLQCSACGGVVPINGFVAEVSCSACERRTPLDDVAWQRLFDEPLRTRGSSPPSVEHAATFQTESGVFRRVHRFGALACSGCHAALDAAMLLPHATSPVASGVRCPGCHANVGVRPPPPALAAAGVVALIGESDVHRAHAPVPLACTKCGGSLSVDGSSRVVTCTYCQATQYLPSELFLQLRAVPVTRWSLLFREGAAPRAAAAQLASWQQVIDVVADASGNVYAWGMVDGTGALWSMGPDMALRWRREGLRTDFTRVGLTQIALTPSGHVLVWDGKGADAVACADGVTAFRYSGQPGEGQRLETHGARALAVDVDASIVFISEDQRLLRTHWHGEPIATWGEGARVNMSTADSGPAVFELGDQPLRVRYGLLAASWSGHVCIQSTIEHEQQCHVACYDRAGKRVFSGKCPRSIFTNHRPLVDAGGNVYVADTNVLEGSPAVTVYRIDPSGRSVAWLGPRERGGLLGQEELMACTPNGTLFMVGQEGAMRRFGPDGRVQFVSPASEKADQRAAMR